MATAGGSSVENSPADEAVAKSLPVEEQAAEDVVSGELVVADEAASPPPAPSFVPESPVATAGQSPRLIDGAAYRREVTSADGSLVVLGGIAFSEDRPIAVINGSVVSPGDMIGGFTVIRIEAERVELESDGVRIFLFLH